MSVGLSSDVNFKWNMPICAEICRAEEKYIPFLGPSPSAISGKKIQCTETYTNDATLRSGFFPQDALGDGPAFWIFFQDSRIRVNLEQSFDEILWQVFKVMPLSYFDGFPCQNVFAY